MRRLLLACAAVLVLGTSAYAGQCPNLVKKVDEALATTTLADADKAKVMELRNQGETQHSAGQHAESVASLNEALKALGM